MKKIVSLLLCIVMLCMMLPLNVWAEDEDLELKRIVEEKFGIDYVNWEETLKILKEEIFPGLEADIMNLAEGNSAGFSEFSFSAVLCVGKALGGMTSWPDPAIGLLIAEMCSMINDAAAACAENGLYMPAFSVYYVSYTFIRQLLLDDGWGHSETMEKAYSDSINGMLALFENAVDEMQKNNNNTIFDLLAIYGQAISLCTDVTHDFETALQWAAEIDQISPPADTEQSMLAKVQKKQAEYEGALTGSVLSQGNMTIVVGVAGVALGFLAAMFIFKKKPAVAASEEE